MTQQGAYFDVVAVCIGESRQIGSRRGQSVMSSIGRHPVSTPTVELTFEGIVGDTQTDRRHHGGPDKAIYMYPMEHYEAWAADLGLALSDMTIPSFGENLTVLGLREEDVREGDLFEWGDTRLQVVKYRFPCNTFNLFWGGENMAKRMMANGRCGWYLRVVRTGRVGTDRQLYCQCTDPSKPTIAEMFRAKVNRE